MIEKVSSDKYSQFKMSHNMKFMLNDDKGVLYVHKNYVAEGVEGFSTASSSHVVSYNRRLENISPKIYYLLSCNFLLLFSKKSFPYSSALLCSRSFVRRRHQHHEMTSWCGKSNAMNYDMQFPFVISYYSPLIFLSHWNARLPIWSE